MSIVKVAFVSSMLLALVSCGGDSNKKSAPQAQQETVSSSLNWKILLPSQDFPARGKAVVTVDGDEVVNECNDKQQFEIDRDSNQYSLSMNGYTRPAADTVNVSVANCATGASFLNVEGATYEISKVDGVELLLLDLDMNL
jgi:hypothetical protein